MSAGNASSRSSVSACGRTTSSAKRRAMRRISSWVSESGMANCFSGCRPQPTHDVGACEAELAVLIGDLDPREAAAGFSLDLLDAVAGRQRVADEHRAQEPDLVVTERDGDALRAALDGPARDHRCGRGQEPHDEPAMGDAAAELTGARIVLVDVDRVEIARQGAEEQKV